MARAIEPSHSPVLYNDVLSALQVRPGSRHIDGTLGAGGHAGGILLASAPDGEVLGLDRDPGALAVAASRLQAYGRRVHLRQGSYADMQHHAHALGWRQVEGVLLDLGVSSMQLDDPERGFSFRAAGPLDMRFDPDQLLTAADLVNHAEEETLADLIRRFGEEPRARQVARSIVARRPLETTLDLAQAVAAVVRPKRTGLHPATRTFQAIRIAVNDELSGLQTGLEQAVELLAPGGRLVVISFHSLEDRLVKTFLRQQSRDCICPPRQPVCTCGHQAALTLVLRKALKPSPDEIALNPRARSARMRVAARLVQA